MAKKFSGSTTQKELKNSELIGKKTPRQTDRHTNRRKTLNKGWTGGPYSSLGKPIFETSHI